MSLSRGYRNYRGRTPKWKVILAAVLVLVILAAGAVILLQQYIVYDETGTPHLRLPASETADPAAEEPEQQVELTIQEPEKEQTAIYAFTVPDTPLTVQGWKDAWMGAAAMSAPAYNAAVVTVKDSGGLVYFDSSTAVSGSTRTAEDTALALTAMTGEDSSYYTVARLSCFHDPKAANADVEGLGLKNTGGYIFYDGNNSQWLDPAKPAARAYLCQMIKETAELGFDEILLTDVSYPTEGKLDKIAYGDGNRTQHLLDFLTEARAVLEPYGAVLSIELPEQVLTAGSDENAGLSLTKIAPLVDRVYATTTPEQTAALAALVTAAGEQTTFVPELESYGPEITGSCVLLK